MVPRINTRGDRVLQPMIPHTITPAVGVVFLCKTKAGLRRSIRGLNTRTRLSSLLRLNLDSSVETNWFHSIAVQFNLAQHHSKRRCRWLGVKGSTRYERRDPKCPSARRIPMLREDTGVPDEGATCAWIAADEAIGSTCAILTMWRPSNDWSVEGTSSLVFM
ncbi:uncharacterized protein TNCV_45041 [Trichonephila clavipes]|nr:uncharacterized protein TNCV_45041 [Trichonephila clavipes]